MESNRMEYKRELNDRLERAVVSFLNYVGGGEIVIGMNDDNTVHGVDDCDAVQLKIADRIRNNIRPQTLGLFDVVREKVFSRTEAGTSLKSSKKGQRLPSL